KVLPTKVMSGNSSTLNQSAPLRSVSRGANCDSRLLVLTSTLSLLATGLAGSNAIVPVVSPKRPIMFEKPRWLTRNRTCVWLGSILKSAAAAGAAAATRASEAKATEERRRIGGILLSKGVVVAQKEQ